MYSGLWEILKLMMKVVIISHNRIYLTLLSSIMSYLE